jgi:hypothetical protein
MLYNNGVYSEGKVIPILNYEITYHAMKAYDGLLIIAP